MNFLLPQTASPTVSAMHRGRTSATGSRRSSASRRPWRSSRGNSQKYPSTSSRPRDCIELRPSRVIKSMLASRRLSASVAPQIERERERDERRERRRETVQNTRSAVVARRAKPVIIYQGGIPFREGGRPMRPPYSVLARRMGPGGAGATRGSRAELPFC